MFVRFLVLIAMAHVASTRYIMYLTGFVSSNVPRLRILLMMQ